MFAQYPDVEFEWTVHTEAKEKGPMSPLELDWEVKFLEGTMVGCEDVVSDLETLIHEQEQRLVNHTAPGNGLTMLEKHHLSTRYKDWNLFYIDHPATEVLWEFIKEGHDRYLELYDLKSPEPSVQSWANVLRKGDQIGSHIHAGPNMDSAVYLSTNFCVTADETTSTVYDSPGHDGRLMDFQNEPGQLLVFPSWIPHFTTPFEKEDSTRITIASDFDLYNWYEKSFTDGERTAHWLPFDTHPGIKHGEDADSDWGDVKGVDGTIARLVNYSGELTEDVVVEMKENGTDFAKRNLVPEGVDLSN